MVDFTKLASQNIGDVERPPLAPIGHYRMKVQRVPEMDPRPDGEWYIIEFTLQGVEAYDDVDPDELAAFGSPTSIITRKAFMCQRTDEAEAKRMMYNVKRFLTDHLQCADDDMSIKEALAQSVGAECMVELTHRQDKNDPELFHLNAGRTAAAE